MKKAWIENTIIRDVAQGNPAETYHPDVAARYTVDVPDNAENGDTFSGGVLTKKPAPVTPVYTPPDPGPGEPESRKITQLAFISRFTDAEAIAIDLASIGATQQAAGMRRFQKKVDAATFIDLERADTRGGVQTLEAAGLLAAGRAAIILDGPIVDLERYRG